MNNRPFFEAALQRAKEQPYPKVCSHKDFANSPNFQLLIATIHQACMANGGESTFPQSAVRMVIGNKGEWYRFHNIMRWLSTYGTLEATKGPHRASPTRYRWVGEWKMEAGDIGEG